MLQVTIPAAELYDHKNEEFIETKEQKLQLEHSLVSMARWESKWKKPFLGSTTKSKTQAESLDYIRCMTLTQNVDPKIYSFIPDTIVEEVAKYIDDPMTATVLPKQQSKGAREVITAEIIYYWMISFNVPFECQKWHLNRLLTLINVCSIKNSPKKKMSSSEIASRNRALNAERLKNLNTKG